MPKLDILLLRPAGQETWNDEQRALLPDGLRDSDAGRLMLEFKHPGPRNSRKHPRY